MELPETFLCRYAYDALDRLTGLVPSEQEEVQRFYNIEHLATELQGQTSRTVFQEGTQLLALQQREGDELNNQLLATDQQRSVLHAIDGVQHRQKVYSPYGHRRAESGLSSLLGFNGERPDPVTGHYLLGNGHRAFNPVLMRFNSPDRLSPFGQGGLNPYAYCLGDPVNRSDPTGQFTRLVTSFFNLGSSRFTLSSAIPFKTAKDALQWGAVGHLPLKYTVGAASSVIVGTTSVLSAITGIASAVAAITKDSEAARDLGFISLGLAGVTIAARLGSYWVARDPKAVSALKDFIATKSPSTQIPSGLPGMVPDSVPPSPIPTAPPLTPKSPIASAPPQTPGPNVIGFKNFSMGRGIKRTFDDMSADPAFYDLSSQALRVRLPVALVD
ncbi:RHS repeat-associated core domain-containing protein [Pseudomonas sp. H11T01]|uniref:RHS repeat-associated core domain-containing protein n=1 Tax=Pseudomonas sp. H11T01 TaxID=3402749 RepID=UPI003AC564E2